MALLPGAAESQSLQNQIGIYGRIGFRVCGHVLCNRPAYAFVNQLETQKVHCHIFRLRLGEILSREAKLENGSRRRERLVEPA
jgi:hypothetical protein